MSELKPCKICRSSPSDLGSPDIKGRDEGLALCNKCCFSLPYSVWQRVMDDTPDLLRGARIGLEMAAELCERCDTNSSEYNGGEIRKFTDTDIMKEISREGTA